MKRVLRYFFSAGQRGYTMIEMIAGLALAGLLTVGLAAYLVGAMNVVDDSNDRTQSLMQVENAGFWVTRDVQMSENMTFGENAGFPWELRWKDTDYNKYVVTYSVNGTDLTRSLFQSTDNSTRSVLVARDIDPAPASTNVSRSGDMVAFNVTSNAGGIAVNRVFTVQSRMELFYSSQ